MIEIDGTFGEGGGQILRTSLALSAVTKEPFRIVDIRARRSKAGLLRQHLTGVKAAAEICGATVRGAELGSTTLEFEPGDVRPGNYEFSIGSAGSTTLVLQTILPALASAESPSTVVIEGGTHNSSAPSFEFLRDTFAPALAAVGPRVQLELERHGFYPAGGGRIAATIAPARFEPHAWLERGEIRDRRIVAAVANLPRSIGERENQAIRAKLSWPESIGAIVEVDSPGPGNVVTVQLESEALTETFVGFGERGVRAEAVGDRVAEEVKRYLAVDAPVGEHLADQLVLLLALAGGGRFRTIAPSRHTLTQIEVVPKFLEVDVDVEKLDGGVWEISIAG